MRRSLARGLIEGIAEVVAPTRCAGCDLPGEVFCSACVARTLADAWNGRCPRCAAPYGEIVCTECWNMVFSFRAATVVGTLDGPLARAVVLHKDAGERRLGPLLGTLLARGVEACFPSPPDHVTWVPATRAALARRGFDHARALAAPVARCVGVPLEPLLARPHAVDQRGLGRESRRGLAQGSFVAEPGLNGCVLVIDDVMTTGATLDAAADALLRAGADVVDVAAVARAW